MVDKICSNTCSKFVRTHLVKCLRGNGSFRPRVVSALSRFGRGSFRPGSFRPGSIRPWVVSAQFGGSFRPIFSQLSGLYRRSTKYTLG